MRTLRTASMKKLARLLVLGCLFLLLTGEVCVEERDVDMVVAAEIIEDFVASGEINVYDGEETVFLDTELDIDEILEENGIDSLKSVTVQAAFYRVTEKDTGAPTRTITGTVGIRKGGGPETTLITLTSVAVNDDAYANWTPVPMEAPGVATLNQALAELVAGNSGVTVTFHSAGVSSPTGVPTFFTYQVRLRLNVVGTLKVKVIDPL